ncbi:hypothetical protein GDO81_019839 [Engystomops pustulosus]|uniref:Uncharacterized protein n=1 Tax=Engystomops pustulosus TaxID=76066 RepID=A0AAV6ZF67_ENGPU|nr:hypothetical protein GDO81_019839 [Engystomops pustulosus]
MDLQGNNRQSSWITVILWNSLAIVVAFLLSFGAEESLDEGLSGGSSSNIVFEDLG